MLSGSGLRVQSSAVEVFCQWVVFYICVDLSSLCARVLVYLSLGLDWILLSSLETVKGLQHGLNTSRPVRQHLSWVSLFIKQHKTVTVIL